jgi:sialate O-acetylesterase
MIADWRGRWGEGNFPFLIVQLAGYTPPPAQPGDDAWAELREAQWMTAQDVPNAGIATAIDIGNAGDIHPKDKQDVGRRLALVAEHQVYHENVEGYGPVYKTMSVTGSTVRISFTHVGGGLVAQGGGAVTGFAVAGADHKWSWAGAKVVGDSVLVSSAQVPAPVAVRYAWAAGPIGNLASQDGLPAFPFRTDDWPGITVNNK